MISFFNAIIHDVNMMSYPVSTSNLLKTDIVEILADSSVVYTFIPILRSTDVYSQKNEIS